MKSFFIFLLSLSINVLLFSALSGITAPCHEKSEDIPIQITFITTKAPLVHSSKTPLAHSGKTPVAHSGKAPLPAPENKQVSAVIKKERPKPKAVALKTKTAKPAIKPSASKQAIKEIKSEDVKKLAKLMPAPQVTKQEVKAGDAGRLSIESALNIDDSLIDIDIDHNDISMALEEDEPQQVPESLEPQIAVLSGITKFPAIMGEISPAFPEKARRMNKVGTVQLEVTIDSSGHVIEAKVIKSAGYGFDEAAMDAVRVAKFEPAMADEEPVPVRVMIPIKFTLE
jgi:protein TonB